MHRGWCLFLRHAVQPGPGWWSAVASPGTDCKAQYRCDPPPPPRGAPQPWDSAQIGQGHVRSRSPRPLYRGWWALEMGSSTPSLYWRRNNETILNKDNNDFGIQIQNEHNDMQHYPQRSIINWDIRRVNKINTTFTHLMSDLGRFEMDHARVCLALCVAPFFFTTGKFIKISSCVKIWIIIAAFRQYCIPTI